MSSRLLAGRKHAKRIHDSSEEEEEADAVRSSVDSSNKTEGNAAESSKEDPPKRKKKSGGNWQLSAEKSVHSHIDSISRRRLISGKQVLEDQIYIEKEFVERILSWRINKSKEIEKESLSEVVLQEMDLSRKGNLRFSDAEHYIEFFESLIYEECKVKAQSELINNAKPVEVISLKSILSDSEEDGVVIRSRFKLSFEPNQKHSFQEPKELVALELEIKPQYQGSSVKRVFKLAFSNQAAASWIIIRAHFRSSGNSIDDDFREGLLHLENPQSSKSKNHYRLFVYKLDSSITRMRMFCGLWHCQSLPLMPYILSPVKGYDLMLVSTSDWDRIPSGLLEIMKASLNESQVNAVREAMTRKNGFCLLQGPPGTGKTKTVLALLNCFHLSRYQQHYDSVVQAVLKIFHKTSDSETELDEIFVNQEKANSSGTVKILPRPKILVCAPSNAGVDEIVARLQEIGLVDGNRSRYNPDIVRIGANERVRQGVRGLFSLEAMADAFYKYTKDQLKARIVDFKSKIHQCTQNLIFFHNQAQSFRNARFESEEKREEALTAVALKYIQTREDLYRINLEIKRCEHALLNNDSNGYGLIRKSYLQEAQIVFSTLSGSAMSFFREADLSFDLCIIDEAAQCVEVSTLLPLFHQISTCILVGDPRQLPATVFLNGGASELYEQSMFTRFQRNGHPVLMLDKQYRMHPNISKFPSDYFYDGLLTNGDNVTSSEYTDKPYYSDQRFAPFVLWDVSTSEAKHGFSLYNQIEADFIGDLLGLFLEKFSSDCEACDIGVITPYREQMRRLNTSLEAKLGKERAKQIEVATVDAFQGREKKIIVISCVRASSSSGIGFVSDIRRMNVMITRAKHALWIVGNIFTLEKSEPWKALVEYAEKNEFILSGALEDPITGRDSDRSEIRESLTDTNGKAGEVIEDEILRENTSLSMVNMTDFDDASSITPHFSSQRREPEMPLPPIGLDGPLPQFRSQQEILSQRPPSVPNGPSMYAPQAFQVQWIQPAAANTQIPLNVFRQIAPVVSQGAPRQFDPRIQPQGPFVYSGAPMPFPNPSNMIDPRRIPLAPTMVPHPQAIAPQFYPGAPAPGYVFPHGHPMHFPVPPRSFPPGPAPAPYPQPGHLNWIPGPAQSQGPGSVQLPRGASSGQSYNYQL